MMNTVLATAIGLVLLASAPAQSNSPAERFWPQWRGPYATGVSQHADPPVEWSETKNIRWKVEIPGRGSSSPVVWGDRVFLLTAIPAGVEGPAQHDPRGGLRPRGVHRFMVLAINRRDGTIAWQRTVREQEPHESSHQENGTWASGSAATDGQHVFAYFESFGLYAFDMDGNPLWEKDLGDKRMRNQFGEGSTPALYRDRLVIAWDNIGAQSFVVALDKNTGAEVWRANRNEIDTWATPLVVEHNGRPQAYAEGFALLDRKTQLQFDLPQIAELWRHGSVIRSWVLDLTSDALRENPGMSGIEPYVADSGEGRWMVAECIAEDVPAPIISLSLIERLRSRDRNSFSSRLLAVMRKKFGGHSIVTRP